MYKVIAMLFSSLMLLALSGCVDHETADPSFVKRENDKVYIIDRTGQRWDVTEAVSMGFTPSGFGHGIGRDTLSPLVDPMLTAGADGPDPSTRVIGIDDGDEAKAFSVTRLKLHEVANVTTLGKPVAVGY